MEQLLLSNTINNIKNSFHKLGIDHDMFMTELAKYNGVIAGSFMFMQFGFTKENGTQNFLGAKCEYNDIDVYIEQHEGDKNPRYDDFTQYYHPSENFLVNVFKGCDNNTKSESYIFMDGIVLSRTYKIGNTNINVVLLSHPPLQFINENFDLDCCKIVYDGKSCHVYNIDELCNGVTTARYNKCSVDHVYRDKPAYFTDDIPAFHSKLNCTLYRSDAFQKFKLLFKAYENKKSTKIHANVPSQYDDYLKYISLTVDVNKVFENKTLSSLDRIKITDDVVKIISMIRTHERIDKYKLRGITKVKLQVGEIVV